MQNKKNIKKYLEKYGYIIPNAEIYQKSNSWDLGPNGLELKNSIKKLWREYFVRKNPNNIEIDTLIITKEKVLNSSGHLKNFCDWLIECHKCKKRYRIDHILEEKEFKIFLKEENKENFFLRRNCQICKENFSSKPKFFNLLLKTSLSKEEGNLENIAYLRPETCQGIFVNFKNVKKYVNKNLPIGIAQIGKSYRNEFSRSLFLFRLIEFEQAEIEFFCKKEESKKWWKYWLEESWNFLNKIIKNEEKIRIKEISEEELPHYSKKTTDFQFDYHFGWGEICSISYRGDFDLKQHEINSKIFLGILENGEKITPHVVEVSFGIERIMLAILENSYIEETKENSKREFLNLNPVFSPYFVIVIPLNKKIREFSYEIYLNLLKSSKFNLSFEEASNIGKIYKKQDSIGTYYCLTVDFESLKDEKVTIRNRNNKKQSRIEKNKVADFLNEKYEKYQKLFFE